MSAPPILDSYMETWVPLCVTVCVSQSPCFCSNTLFRMCTYISTWIYVHLAAHVYSHPLYIVWWKHGCLCVVLCVCHNHPTFGHTPWLECVHASIHVLMSTWVPQSASPPLDSYMETWVPLSGSVCMSQSPCFWSHTFVRIYTCISTWIYVHLTAHVYSTLMYSLVETGVPLCGIVCLSQSPCFWSHTLFRRCTCISTWIYVHLTVHVCSTPFA